MVVTVARASLFNWQKKAEEAHAPVVAVQPDAESDDSGTDRSHDDSDVFPPSESPLPGPHSFATEAEVVKLLQKTKMKGTLKKAVEYLRRIASDGKTLARLSDKFVQDETLQAAIRQVDSAIHDAIFSNWWDNVLVRQSARAPRTVAARLRQL